LGASPSLSLCFLPTCTREKGGREQNQGEMNLLPEKDDEMQSWGVQEDISTSSVGSGSGDDQGFAALVKSLMMSHPMALGFSSLLVPLHHEDGTAAVPPHRTSALEVAAAAWRVAFLPLLH